MAYQYNEDTGVIVPDESSLLSEVQQEYRDAFNDQDLDVSESSPQGTLITAEVNTRKGVSQNNSAVANQINPNESEGVFLDALWALLGGARQGATKSTFSVEPDIAGVSGTVVPLGTIVTTDEGDEFETVVEVIIPISGTITVQFQAVEDGAIPALAGTLTNIAAGGPLGLETVNNSVSATLGRPIESDLTSRQRRRDTVGLNARTGPAAVIAALRDVTGVVSVSFRQNITSSPATIDGILIGANSIYTCVDGGTDNDIGQALLSKVVGGGYTGAVDVTVTEEASGQDYDINFDRPADIPVAVRVTASVPSSINDPISVITQAVLDYANGLIVPDRGFVIDADVSPFEISAAVNIQNPEVFVRAVVISENPGSPTFSTDFIAIAMNEKATLEEADIEVVIV